MRNGIYTAAKDESTPHTLVVVCDNEASEYTVSWYGDLAIWEMWKSTRENVDVSGYADNEYPDMLADMLNMPWDAIYVDFYESDLDHLPESREELREFLGWWEETFSEQE